MVHQEAANYHKKLVPMLPVPRLRVPVLRYPTDLSLINEARKFCEQIGQLNDPN